MTGITHQQAKPDPLKSQVLLAGVQRGINTEPQARQADQETRSGDPSHHGKFKEMEMHMVMT